MFFLLMAANSMRYCACSTVEIGDQCHDSDIGRLECTLMPPRRLDDDCTEVAIYDHPVAICAETANGLTWQHYSSCSDGKTCRTDGEEFECHQAVSYGCHDDEQYISEPAEW